jgi:hypothetical protein
MSAAKKTTRKRATKAAKSKTKTPAKTMSSSAPNYPVAPSDAAQISGFKGFDKNLQCRGFQYEVGKTFTHAGKVAACESGFHFCEHPLDVFGYYPPGSSRFAAVRGSGQTSKPGSDTKVACSKLHVEAELDLSAMIKAAVKFVFDRATWSNEKTVNGDREGAVDASDSGAASATGYSGAASATGYSGAASATGYSGAASATGYSGAASATGYRGAASATGYRGAASATGYSGAASATGYRGAASATGYSGAASATGDSGAASATGRYGIAASYGIEGRASGALGVWLVLSEWEVRADGRWHRIGVRTALVDGEKIKANTFYKLSGGEFVEVSS